MKKVEFDNDSCELTQKEIDLMVELESKCITVDEKIIGKDKETVNDSLLVKIHNKRATEKKIKIKLDDKNDIEAKIIGIINNYHILYKKIIELMIIKIQI